MMNRATAWKIAFILTMAGYLLIMGMFANQADKIVNQNSELKQQVESLTNEHQADTAKINDLIQQASDLQKKLSDKQKTSRGGEREPVLTSLGTYTITAYCSCEKCCGEYARNRPGGIVTGAAGIELQEGISVAAPLPIGTELLINGHRYIVQDRTADWIVDRYSGKIVDIYYTDHEAAWNFGKQQAEVYEVMK